MRAAILVCVCLLATPALAASTQMGIVYACASASLRRVIVPDDDKQLTAQSWIGKGECFLIVPQSDDIAADILKATGKQPVQLQALDPLTGEIVMADPAIDAIDGTALQAVPLPADPLPSLTLQDLQGTVSP